MKFVFRRKKIKIKELLLKNLQLRNTILVSCTPLDRALSSGVNQRTYQRRISLYHRIGVELRIGREMRKDVS